jgi:hypothetical protein
MAIIKKMEKINLERDSKHTEVNCTYAIVQGDDGEKYLQIDTYGSKTRKIPGKKSQSIRLSPEAIKQLKGILKTHF